MKKSTEQILIGNKSYPVAPPTVASLILVSELVAKMPQVEMKEANLVNDTLNNARDCRVLGDIVAVLILGANGTRTKRKILGLIPITNNTRAHLAKEILAYLSPIELSNLVQKLLIGMQLPAFFSIASYLIGVNLTKETKEQTPISQ